MQRAMDPLGHQRQEMPCYEFDGVDFFCNQPGRGGWPACTVQAYFDSNLGR